MLRALPPLLLIATTAIWGWTFVVVRDAVVTYPVLPFLAIRFLLAGVLLLPILLRPGYGLRAGVIPGVFLAAAYTAQTFGLQHTTASQTGLLTGLFVVFTPLLEFVIFRRSVAPLTVVAATGAFLGTVLLATGGQGLAVARSELWGDGLVISGSLLFSGHIILLGRVPRSCDTSRVALAQMFVGGGLFAAGAGVTGGFPPISPAIWGAIIITAVLASAAGFWIQTFVQQRLTPARTALILVTEPAFATFFGVWLAGDRFNAVQAAGALLIVTVLLIHEAAPLLYASTIRSAAT